jgi:putative membrane protein
LSKNDDYRSFSRGDLLTKQNRKYDRILVLCIDRDDDIGSKGGIETPVIGRDSCINAGTRLAIEDPEDSDANAIFAAVKTYEDLLKRGYQAEVALVAGKYNRGIE